MSIENDILEIELGLEHANEMVEMGKSIDRLYKNKDFKRVILNGYFEKEAIRLVQLKADPNMQSPEKQQSIIKGIDAIGSLQYFLFLQAQFAARAKQDIEEAEHALDELRAEA